MWIHIRHIFSILAISLLATCAAYWQWTLPIDRWLYDHAIALHPAKTPTDIVIVAIDDQSIQSLGRWPWPRQYHADLINILRDANAKAIAFDVIFPDKDSANPQHDKVFVDAVKNTSSIILPMALEQIQLGGQILERLPFDELARAAKNVGHVHIEQDEDGVCRSVFLREGISTAYWPHLSLAILDSINESPTFLTGIRNNVSLAGNSMLITRDYYNLISFVGKAGSFPSVSYIDVLNNDIPSSTFKDKIIFVGRVANGTNDVLVTPVGIMPGVELNANIFNALRNNLLMSPFNSSYQALITGLTALVLITLLSFISPRNFLVATSASALILSIVSFLILSKFKLWFAPGALICSILIFYPFWNWQRLEKMLHYLKIALKKLEPSIKKSRIDNVSKIQYFQRSLTYLHDINLVDDWSITDLARNTSTADKIKIVDNLKINKENIQKKTNKTNNNLYSIQSFDFISGAKKYRSSVSWSGSDRTLFDRIFSELKLTAEKNDQSVSYRIEVVDKTLLELNRATKIAEYNQNLVDSSIKNLPEAVILTNLFGHVLQANDQALTLWEGTSGFDNFIQLTDTFKKITGFNWSENLSALAFYSNEFSIEIKHIKSNRIFICQGKKIEVEPNTPGIMLFTFNEITALRASEQARLDTLHFLSHDLRAPMNSILALIQHAKHKEQYNGNLLNRIEDYVQTNLDYSQQILQLAKAEESQPKDFYVCDLIEIIDNAIEEIYPIALSKKITFNKNQTIQQTTQKQSLDVLADGQLLERMFINLLSNAIKFSPEGETIDIDIFVDLDDENSAPNESSSTIKINITDHGIGIPEERIPRLFDRFSTSSKKNPLGIGLGLYFVSIVCRRHGGKIQVSSSPGIGSCFSVLLPSYKFFANSE